MRLTNLLPTIAAVALLQSDIQAAPTRPINLPQIRSTTSYPPIATPQRLTLLLTPSLPSYPIPPSTSNTTSSTPPSPETPANTTLLVSTRVSPTGAYPFTNSTFEPNGPDPSTPVPFTWMKVQVSRQDGGGVVVEWTKVPVDVEEWGMWFDVAKLGDGGDQGEKERRVPLSVVGVSPDGIQSFWGSGEVVVVEE
ncbi:hypothetical protein DM02DRAFT_619933 [Periconia macrospinosa]|uniref:Ubiquitin 3 binding protein But2 C-terminal domain-containing protein n=1 Tax=Periconia macrospinosa TaxID=97972 RepID=A0A2V1D4K6_9PLEO|nr:hypothetical protein DM02DRAFT_619933 [Periconia macrospinosa]